MGATLGMIAGAIFGNLASLEGVVALCVAALGRSWRVGAIVGALVGLLAAYTVYSDTSPLPLDGAWAAEKALITIAAAMAVGWLFGLTRKR